MAATTMARPSLGVAGVVAVGALAATFAVAVDWRLAASVGATVPLLVAVLLAENDRPPHLAAGTSTSVRSLFQSDRWIAYTWVALVLVPTNRVFSQDAQRYEGQAASGNLSLDNLLMLAVSIAALLAIVFALQRGWPAAPGPLTWVYLAFSGWAWLSFAWSSVPLYTFGRGLQYVAVAAFAALTAARCQQDARFLDRILDLMLPLHVAAVVALGLWGIIDVGTGVDRFHWRGTHPNAVASVLAIAALFVLVNPRRARLLAPVPWPLPLVFFAWLIVETKARGYSATVLAAVMAGVIAMGTKDSRWWGLGVGGGLTIAGLSLWLWPEQILSFILRGQSAEEFTTLTGRVDAWKWALANPPGSEVVGVGLGANQGTIQVDWSPYNAHNAWIDVLQSLGVIGVALLATVVLGTLLLSLQRRVVVATMLATYVLAASVTSSTIAMPNTNAALLGLGLAAVVGAARAPRAQSAPADRPRQTLQTKVGLPTR